MNTCNQCGNEGYPDSWPFVQWRELPSEGSGEGVILCGDCWADAQEAMPGDTEYEATCHPTWYEDEDGECVYGER